MKTPVIAIIGRPNVGKSTFFNRIIAQRKAIVQDEPGVTRDRNYYLTDLYRIPFTLVDTGGFESSPKGISEQVVEQTMIATEQADLIFALFDAHAGLQQDDIEIVSKLREQNKPVIYVVNKCDGQEQSTLMADFYSLGIDNLKDVSALHGRKVKELVEESLTHLDNYKNLCQSIDEIKLNIGNVKDKLSPEITIEEADIDEFIDENINSEANAKKYEKDKSFAPVFDEDTDLETIEKYFKKFRTTNLPNKLQEKEESFIEDNFEDFSINTPEVISIAIVGQPNSGKSTLLNKLINEERAIICEVAGTTRDSLAIEITRDGQKYKIIDTAGIRRKSRISNKIERYTVIRALSAISECDVAVVLIDAEKEPSEQDGKILGLAHDQGKGIIIAINKWDLVSKDHKTQTKYIDKVKEAFSFSPYAPILFISAKTGKRCPQVISTIKEIAIERSKRVSTSLINKVLSKAVKKHSPPIYRARPIKLFYGAQVGFSPPRFALFFNYPKHVHFSYLRYLKNELRNSFGFIGTDIKLVTKKRGLAKRAC